MLHFGVAADSLQLGVEFLPACHEDLLAHVLNVIGEDSLAEGPPTSWTLLLYNLFKWYFLCIQVRDEVISCVLRYRALREVPLLQA